MTQQAGLPNSQDMLMHEWEFMNELLSQSNFEADFNQTQQREELVMHIMSQPATPSKGPTSSFIDWAVLGHVLERTTGKPFQQLVQEEVFTMLGMEGCGFGPNTINSSLPPSQPWGHLTGPFGLYNLPITPSNQAASSSALVPSNGINCDMESFRKLLKPHLAEDEDYLPADIWNELHSVQASSERGLFGFGMKLLVVDGLGKVGYGITEISTQNACTSYADFYILFDLDAAVFTRINTYIVAGMKPYAGHDVLRTALIGEAILGMELDLSELRNLQ